MLYLRSVSSYCVPAIMAAAGLGSMSIMSLSVGSLEIWASQKA